MILYHFCPAHLVRGIMEQGLCVGMFPLIGGGHVTMLEGYQWLTAEKDPAKQSWATRQIIPYSRIACRLTVDIPLSRIRKLYRAVDFVKSFEPEQQEIVTEWPGSDQWYVYKGRIPPKWISSVVHTGM